jgi:hypothetical protein
MKQYNTYIVTNRFKGVSICGDLNLPYGTECTVNDGFIICDRGVVCAVTSQNAYDYFSQNDDGNAKERGKLVHSIRKTLERYTKFNPKKKQEVWDKIWNDKICLKYKREDYEDHWLWNYDFYNAELYDLRYIAKLVGAK